MRRRTSLALTGTLAGVLAAGIALPIAPAVAGKNHHKNQHGGGSAVGLVGGDTLVSFSTSRPGKVKVLGDVDGLRTDTSLVGIDRRVQDGALYGVGNAGGVYKIDRRGDATLANRLNVALSGTRFGVDFNPAADRLRIISDTGQNLRHDVNPGGATLVDGTLTYPPATTTATGIVAGAYTNNDLDTTTATTLFDLDSTLDQVAVQSPANGGTLAATGRLGVDATDAGFDIGRKNAAFATIRTGSGYALYRVDLLDGGADRIGRFPSRIQVTDLALPIGR